MPLQSSVREKVNTRAEYLERVMDVRQLEFARWLVERGKLSEGDGEV
jgi:hypothetical protein